MIHSGFSLAGTAVKASGTAQDVRWTSALRGLEWNGDAQLDAAGSVLWGLGSFPNKQGFHVTKDGYFPAYHMNKEKWLSIQLGKPKLDNAIKDLLSLSYELTAPKKRDRKSPVNNSGNPANGKAKETNEG